MQYISFMTPGHRITAELYQYTRDLLAWGTYTNKQTAEITGLGTNTVCFLRRNLFRFIALRPDLTISRIILCKSDSSALHRVT